MSLVRSSLLVGLGAALSRILGFARDILFASALGAGPVADAFLAAFRVPNFVRRVLGEGGLNPVLIPALGRLDEEAASGFAGDVLTVFALLTLGLIGLVELSGGLLALMLAPGFADDPQTLNLVALYTRLGFPSILGITLASVVAALLNVRRRFAAATFAPLAVNGGLVLMLLGLPYSNSTTEQKAIWLAVASSLAGLVQLAIVALALRQAGGSAFRFRKPRWSPALRGVLMAGLPVLAASGAIHIFILIGTQMASFWPSGVSWLYYADRLMQLPLGLVAALGSSVLLPELASRLQRDQHEAVIAAQNNAMGFALLFALPAMTALMLLAEPIAAVLFQRGAFTVEDTAGTAQTLMGLSLGLPFAAIAKVISQTLFARGSIRGTVLALIAGAAATGLCAALLGWRWGVPGIALGISLGCAAQTLCLAVLLRLAGLWAPDRALAHRLLRIALACLVLAVGLVLGPRLIAGSQIALLTGLCLGGFMLYGAAAWLLGAVTHHDIRLLRAKP